MDSKVLKVLIEAGAIKSASVIADGSTVYLNFTTRNGDTSPATTLKGKIKTWSTLDAACKWLRGVGIGEAKLKMASWSPNQRNML